MVELEDVVFLLSEEKIRRKLEVWNYSGKLCLPWESIVSLTPAFFQHASLAPQRQVIIILYQKETMGRLSLFGISCLFVSKKMPNNEVMPQTSIILIVQVSDQ